MGGTAQTLIYAGQMLEDDKPLVAYGVPPVIPSAPLGSPTPRMGILRTAAYVRTAACSHMWKAQFYFM